MSATSKSLPLPHPWRAGVRRPANRATQYSSTLAAALCREAINGLQFRAARGFLAWDRRDLAEKAVVTIYTLEERGWTLTKTNAAARYGTMPIRFVLRDNHGLIHFRNLDEVERRLNAKAKQS